MYFAFCLVLGFVIGMLACAPIPRKSAHVAVLSAVFGVAGAGLGWWAGIAMNMHSIGPAAQIFVSVVASTAVVAVYQMAIAEPPTLR